MSTESIKISSAWHDVAARLDQDGFALFTNSLFDDDSEDLREARASLVASSLDLPRDPYSAVPGRNRRYGRFILNPKNGAINAQPSVWDDDRRERVMCYRQLGMFNPEHPGNVRAFAALTEEQTVNQFLRSLIARCFSSVRWPWDDPVIVGVHILQYAPERGKSLFSSPAEFHCDGEPFTWGFLLGRTNIAGGENMIATLNAVGKDLPEVSPRDIRARITLETLMEGWVVNDLKVSHYVSPFRVTEGAEGGQRTLLLVDFTPASLDCQSE